MMGRITCTEEPKTGKRNENDCYYPTNDGAASSLYMNTAKSIPLHHSQKKISFPPISSNEFRSQSSQLHRPASSFAEISSLQDRAQTSFQESALIAEAKELRNTALSPNQKLPPIVVPKPPSAARIPNMPPHSISEMPDPLTAVVENKEQCSPFFDLKMAYENMMVGYFMQQGVKPDASLPCNIQTEQSQPNYIQRSNQGNINPNYAYQPPNEVQQTIQSVPTFDSAFYIPQILTTEEYAKKQHEASLGTNRASTHNRKNILQKSKNITHANVSPSVNQHTSMDITSSGCTVLDTSTFGQYQEHSMNTTSNIAPNEMLKPENDNYNPCSLAKISSTTVNTMQTCNIASQPALVDSGDQSSSLITPDMSSVLNDLSMFMIPQNNATIDLISVQNNARTSFTTTTTTTSTTSVNSFSSQYQPKPDSTFGRFSVLPSVASTATPGSLGDGDNLSLMSYASVPGNAQNSSQMGMYCTSFSPFSVNFHENFPSTFNSSPRYSGRSSYSSRSRNKRALSNSPLSAEGIDLNSIIRMSPTSLVAYINGSRSSSSCVSPGSYGEKAGCYGHLSARNSSSSPHSGSASSGNRRSSSYTPQTGTPGNSSAITSDNSNLSNACLRNEKMKNDFLNLDENLLVIQAMQDLESGVDISSSVSLGYNNNTAQNAQMMPEFENLQVLPQDLAAFATEDYIPFIPTSLPPVHTHLPAIQPVQNQPLQTLSPPQKPPPTYDQHMARKALLQKNSSSESSSQPSNSSSFESSEGDKTAGGNSSTDTETNRMYACRWLDCAAVFHDQEEFVTHIEKIHIDQKKGDDFICFWKLCPRRLHPFNARYKLLVHMRIHSGDKPNKCTFAGCKKAFSRLENLKIHLRSHTGERPYSCTYPGCTKTFSNSSDRTKHQKTHQDTKPYVCQVAGCGKKYTDPSSLRKHVKKSHPEKKEPDRKKIRGGVEELDPKDLSECLVIQAIKPTALCDASPPEPTDSGLGRSPRSSQPGSSSDHYPGLIYSGETLNLNETVHGSCHTSPSSHHSSPRSQIDSESLPPNNNSLRVPVLPPIAPPLAQQNFSFPNQVMTSSRNTPSLPRTITSPNVFGQSRNSFQNTQMHDETARRAVLGIHSVCSNNINYKQPDSSSRSALKS